MTHKFILSTLTLVAFTFLLVLTACNRNSSNVLNKTAKINRSFILKFDETIRIPEENLSIYFQKINESRCPKDVKCVWVGEAIVTFEVKVDAQKEDLVLKVKGNCNENEKCGEVKNVLKYNIELVSLTPYPTEILDKEEAYQAEMIITKDE